MTRTVAEVVARALSFTACTTDDDVLEDECWQVLGVLVHHQMTIGPLSSGRSITPPETPASGSEDSTEDRP